MNSRCRNMWEHGPDRLDLIGQLFMKVRISACGILDTTTVCQDGSQPIVGYIFLCPEDCRQPTTSTPTTGYDTKSLRMRVRKKVK